jgi:Ca2+-binding EF-hand superfamily protein
MAVFSILDREKSGYITKENFKTALSGGKNDQLMHNFEDCWKKITDAVNTKKEQQMDFEEFKTGMRIMKQITNPEYVAY